MEIYLITSNLKNVIVFLYLKFSFNQKMNVKGVFNVENNAVLNLKNAHISLISLILKYKRGFIGLFRTKGMHRKL